jgi:hypothetical protein
MENKGLLFIPDISGFTRFVTETEIGHSRLIIQELLELLINANQTELEISEVEGDAILFYRFGEAPALQELYTQVARMFSDFHRHLQAYDALRFCQCKACISAVNLSLKVITHYGEFTRYNVKNFQKLIGKDVIVAHQLLKNDIDQHEYWLVTNALPQSDPPRGFTGWMEWSSSQKLTESGAIPFHYAPLSALKKELPPSPPLGLELSKRTKVLTASREFGAHIITLFHASGGFQYRHRWQEGVKKVEELTHFLPRVGMKNRRILENGEAVVYASSYSFHPEKIQFSETDEQKRNSTYFTLEKIDKTRTKLTVDLYIRKNIFREIAFKLFKKKKLKVTLERSLGKLETLLKEIHVETEY